tara:strand:- start:3304 stop:3906 length:603 start_codon:yes stop_codon:yes gene_type:complete
MLSQFYYNLKNFILAKTRLFTQSKYAYPFIFFVGFLEAIIFPFPQEIFMIPMMAAEKSKIFKIAFISLLGSIIGAVFAYFIGMYLFETIGTYILNLYTLQYAYDSFAQNISANGFLYVFIGGFTPIPFKVITLSSAGLGVGFYIFIIGSIISRSARFFLVGFIIWKYGEPFMKIFEKRLAFFSILFVVVLISILVILNIK